MSQIAFKQEREKVKEWKRYPAYKDSGVEWLGEVPQHWEVMKCKQLSLIKRGASPRPIDDPSFFDDNGAYSWVRISDVTASNKYLETSEQTLSELGKSKSVALEPGELFVSICATVGKPIITNIKCCIHDGFVYFPYLKENREYLFYIFSGGELYKGLGKQGTQLNLNTDTIGDIKLPIPPLPEQQAIAQFLDRETAKIDTLVAKKERLIELLQEKRTALISHAVTKGLNPDAPMKDSGVEWLGEIPSHWEVKRLKFISFLTMGQSPNSEDYNHNGYGAPFLQGNAEFGSRNPEPKVFCYTANKYAEKGDILISVRAPVGALNEADKKYGIGRGLCSIRSKEFLLFRGFAWFLLEVVKVQLNLVSTGSTYEAVAVADVSNLICSLPPPSEQQAIAQFLDRETAKIDTLIAKTRNSIEKLKEYRTAVISAAVTGKIDVRND